MMGRSCQVFLILALAAGAGCAGSPPLAQAQEAYEAGDYDHAIEISSHWISKGSGPYGAFLLRGKAYEKKGDYTKAIADFDQARRLDPTQGEAAFRQTHCYLAAGLTVDAEASISGALKENYGVYSVRDQMLTHAVHGEVQLAAGDFPRATDSLSAAVKVAQGSRPLAAEGTTSIVYYNLSRAHFEQGAYRRAREAFQGYLDRQVSGGIQPDAQDLYTMAVLHFLCEDVASSRKISSSLPEEYKARLEGILAGDTFSVRALYEQKQKQKQSEETNP